MSEIFSIIIFRLHFALLFQKIISNLVTTDEKKPGLFSVENCAYTIDQTADMRRFFNSKEMMCIKG